MISIGLISDVHYAAGKTKGNRHCHLSDAKLTECLEFFNRKNIEYVICLGDLIDQGDHPDDDQENLAKIAGICQLYKGSFYTAIGNHDLESMTKEQFLERLGIRTRRPYYAFEIQDYRFLVLDPNFKKSGESYRSGHFDWDDAYLPPEQISWLSTRLNQNNYRRTFIVCHQNLDQRLLSGQIDPHIISNADEVRSLIERKNQKITVIQGHFHQGYYQKINDISYFTLTAMCEGGSMKDNSFAVLDLHDDGRVIVNGYGGQETVEIVTRNPEW